MIFSPCANTLLIDVVGSPDVVPAIIKATVRIEEIAIV
jgi:hypothetical protein